MSRPVSRPEPMGGPGLYKTYQIVAPVQTHFRPASCAEVQCAGHRLGFRTIVASDSPQAAYIRARSGRKFAESPAGAGLAQFDFPAGQTCFQASAHRVSLEREPFYLVKDGDYRGNPYGTRPTQRRAGEWVDDFATHQQAVSDRIERG